MINSINIGLTGLHAASTRMANSANNVANVQSTSKTVNGEKINEPYTPRDVHQSALEPTGGVRTELVDRDPATVKVYQPGSSAADADGVVEYPNVSLDEEVVQQKVASYDYKANLKTIETADEMLQNLLDITS